jgi:alcohol dehydrogenase class IV
MVFLPWVLETNSEALKGKLFALNHRLGRRTAETEANDEARWFKHIIERFYEEIGFDPYKIAVYLENVDFNLREVARDTLKQPPAALNPAQVTEEDIEQELRRLMS